MQVFYRHHNETGNAWWPVESFSKSFTFASGVEYKIDGKVYTSNTIEFRTDLIMACLKQKINLPYYSF